jgi:ABC-2 type transport system permease protein
MNLQMMAALVQKDVTLFFKNRFFALITVLGLAAYFAIFYLLPTTVDETLELGWYGPPLPAVITNEMQAEGLKLRTYASEEALQEAVRSGDEPVGVALPADFFQRLASGERPQARVYFGSNLPDEFQEAYKLLMQELSYQIAGKPLNIDVQEVILGPDMAGQQVPPRQRMLPILVVFILMIETFGLASLITSEVETGTARALLVTPLRIEGLFLSKGVTGVSMAFGQALLLIAVTGGLRNEPSVIITALLLGALLVTGLSFLIASISRDMMSVMGWGVVAMVILAIPGFNVLLPGLASGWIKIIPTYYLVDIIYRVLNFEASWSQTGGSLLGLLVYSAAFTGLGIVSLRRKLG